MYRNSNDMDIIKDEMELDSEQQTSRQQEQEQQPKLIHRQQNQQQQNLCQEQQQYQRTQQQNQPDDFENEPRDHIDKDQSAELASSLGPRLTVEQMELIRRLRNTGIAPQAIAEAFKELEKIESDLDMLQIVQQTADVNTVAAIRPNRRASCAVPVSVATPTSVRRATEHNLFTTVESESNIYGSPDATGNSGTVALLLQQIQKQLAAGERLPQHNANTAESLDTLKTMFLLGQRIKLQQQHKHLLLKQQMVASRSRRASPGALSPPPVKKFLLAATSLQTESYINSLDTVTSVGEISPVGAPPPLSLSSSPPLVDVDTVAQAPRRHSAITFESHGQLEADILGHSLAPPLSANAELGVTSGDLSSLLNSYGIGILTTGSARGYPTTIGNGYSNGHGVEPSPSAGSSLLSLSDQQLSADLSQHSQQLLLAGTRKRSSSGGSSSNASTTTHNTINTVTIDHGLASEVGSSGLTFNQAGASSGATVFSSVGASFLYGSGTSDTTAVRSMTSEYGSHQDQNKSAVTGESADSAVALRPIRSQRTPMKDITTLDNPAELEEFMRRGEEACINDMKQFIMQFSLRQTTVAMMTGVSQPYISKLLNGNHRELSMRCRKNIYSWYLNCRRHPAKLALFTQDPSSRLETNGDGELIPQRRERYVFRPLLIKILEAYFAQSAFPDSTKRAEIAQACNQALQMDKKALPGVQLMPKEVVTSQVIANWFANKRKENRRKSHDETLGSAGHGLTTTAGGGYTPPAFTLPSTAAGFTLYGGHTAPPSSAPSALAFQLSSATTSAAAAAAATAASGVSEAAELQTQLQQQHKSYSTVNQEPRVFFDNIGVSSSVLAAAVAQTSNNSPLFAASPPVGAEVSGCGGQPAGAIHEPEARTPDYSSASALLANIEAIRAAAAAATSNLSLMTDEYKSEEDNESTKTVTMTMRSALDNFLDNSQQHLQFLQRSSCGATVETTSSPAAPPAAIQSPENEVNATHFDITHVKNVKDVVQVQSAPTSSCGTEFTAADISSRADFNFILDSMQRQRDAAALFQNHYYHDHRIKLINDEETEVPTAVTTAQSHSNGATQPPPSAAPRPLIAE